MEEVIILEYPISDRYCSEHDIAFLNTTINKIRCGGAWFDFDETRWKIKKISDLNFVDISTKPVADIQHSNVFVSKILVTADKYNNYTVNQYMINGHHTNLGFVEDSEGFELDTENVVKYAYL